MALSTGPLPETIVPWLQQEPKSSEGTVVAVRCVKSHKLAVRRATFSDWVACQLSGGGDLYLFADSH